MVRKPIVCNIVSLDWYFADHDRAPRADVHRRAGSDSLLLRYAVPPVGVEPTLSEV
jgi:hypothetical protein